MIDIQGSKIESAFDIDAVGVTALPYPLIFTDVPGTDPQTQTARWELAASLARSDRGTHMSRFIANLDPFVQEVQSPRDFLGLAENIRVQLGAQTTSVAAQFPWNRRVKAPVTGYQSFMTYPVAVHAITGPQSFLRLNLEIPATALCPCSKAISERGAHNQRTSIKLDLTFPSTLETPSFESLIEIAESSASARLYPILKREDEKFITEQAYDNPAFVEDLVRAVADKLSQLPSIQAFTARVVNQESIHQHDCFAQITWQRSK